MKFSLILILMSIFILACSSSHEKNQEVMQIMQEFMLQWNIKYLKKIV